MTTTKPNLTNLLNKAKENTNPDSEATADTEEVMFQQYHSARIALRLVTDTGVKIKFTNFELLTQDPEVISYLDKEIKACLPGITKGEVVSSADRDPMATMERKLRKEIELEYAEKAKNKALGITVDMGDNGANAGNRINPASSNQTAS